TQGSCPHHRRDGGRWHPCDHRNNRSCARANRSRYAQRYWLDYLCCFPLCPARSNCFCSNCFCSNCFCSNCLCSSCYYSSCLCSNCLYSNCHYRLCLSDPHSGSALCLQVVLPERRRP